MHKAQPVDLHPAAGLLQHLPDHRLLGALPELDAAAHGIIIVLPVVAHHEQLPVLADDRPDPDIQITRIAGDRHVRSHLIHSTVTDFARFRGLSISQPRCSAT